MRKFYPLLELPFILNKTLTWRQNPKGLGLKGRDPPPRPAGLSFFWTGKYTVPPSVISFYFQEDRT